MTRVIAVSNVTKRDIESIFHAPPEKIDVVHEGVDLEAFSFNGNGKNASAFLREYNLPPLYILCVGTHGYKNVEGSIKAFQIVKRQSPDPLKLVIAGNKRSLGEDTYQMVREMGLEQDVIFTDFFPDEDLKYLYRYSNLLLFPSFYEGFGLPILEAFACGTPVVTSKAGALPEVAGDAAILVDPTETQGIADAVLTMMNDQDFREKKRQLGLQRAKQFSWELAARETLKVVETAGMG